MRKEFFKVVFAVSLLLCMQLSAQHTCPQTGADCFGCPDSYPFLECTTDPSSLGYVSIDDIIMGKVIPHPLTSYNVNIVVNEVLYTKSGQIKNGDTVTVGSGGCEFLPVADSSLGVFAMHHYPTIDSSCYYIPKCGKFSLRYQNDTVSGNIENPYQEKMEYVSFKNLLDNKLHSGIIYRNPIVNKDISLEIIQRQKGRIEIRYSYIGRNTLFLSLFEPAGRKVYTTTLLPGYSGTGSAVVPLGFLSNGLYILKLGNGRNDMVTMFVMNR